MEMEKGERKAKIEKRVVGKVCKQMCMLSIVEGFPGVDSLLYSFFHPFLFCSSAVPCPVGGLFKELKFIFLLFSTSPTETIIQSFFVSSWYFCSVVRV